MIPVERWVFEMIPDAWKPFYCVIPYNALW